MQVRRLSCSFAVLVSTPAYLGVPVRCYARCYASKRIQGATHAHKSDEDVPGPLAPALVAEAAALWRY
jgi:hypothetical protein